ncbi:MAG: aminotransferase class V-fold PLP-dependent enzyme [Flavobacteriales bacterium]|nr:aminotransferase class V-fold PLP-dependent enzyme [Flavobacteriales bacterium]
MDCQKHLFSLPNNVHYLNCARKGPLLKSAEEKGIEAIKRDRNPDQISTEDFFSVQEDVRHLFADIVNCAPSQIALLPSTSYGFASVLKNVKAKPSGNAIMVKGEFPSGYFAVNRWADSNGNELRTIEPDSDLKRVGRDWNKRILSSIDHDTSVVLISAIHWMTGVKFDLKTIGEKCSEIGAILVVDGTQAVGASPIDVQECKIHALICAGYKWLFGPYSTALGYFGQGFEQGEPIEESWMNRTNSRLFSELTDYEDSYYPDAGRYNVGQTSNFILMPMLREGLRQITAWTPEGIQEYCSKLTRPLKLYMDSIGSIYEDEEYFADHLFSFHLPESVDQEKLKLQLQEDDISISVRGDSIRISINVFNDPADIEALIASIDRIMRKTVNDLYPFEPIP